MNFAAWTEVERLARLESSRLFHCPRDIITYVLKPYVLPRSYRSGHLFSSYVWMPQLSFSMVNPAIEISLDNQEGVICTAYSDNLITYYTRRSPGELHIQACPVPRPWLAHLQDHTLVVFEDTHRNFFQREYSLLTGEIVFQRRQETKDILFRDELGRYWTRPRDEDMIECHSQPLRQGATCRRRFRLPQNLRVEDIKFRSPHYLYLLTALGVYWGIVEPGLKTDIKWDYWPISDYITTGYCHLISLVVGSNGGIAVINRLQNNILLFSPTGQLVSILDGQDEGCLFQPVNLALSQKGDLYVINPASRRVFVYCGEKIDERNSTSSEKENDVDLH